PLTLVTHQPPPRSPLFPYNDALPIFLVESTCTQSVACERSPPPPSAASHRHKKPPEGGFLHDQFCGRMCGNRITSRIDGELVSRSEEHTSELQSRENLVCRLLLEKKK